MKKIIFTICFIVLLFNLSHGEQPSNSRFLFLKQPVLIKIYYSNPNKGRAIEKKCQEELRRLEKKFSSLIQGSVVNRVNQYGGQHPVEVDQEMMTLMEWGLALGQETLGTFDITSAAYLWHYGFGQQDYRVPNYLLLDSVKPLVNYQLIWVDKKDQAILFKRDGVQINLNQLLVGHAFNKLAKLLEKDNVKQASITIGQNFLALGKSPNEQLWQHKVTSTWQPINLIKQFEINQGQILVYDSYSNSFFEKEKHYHELINPQTGLPYKFGKLAIVYHSKSGTRALPPAVLLTQKPEQAIKLFDNERHSACLIIDQDNQQYFSKQWSKWFKVGSGN